MLTKKKPQTVAALIFVLVGLICLAFNAIHINDSGRLLAANYWLKDKQNPERAAEVISYHGPSIWYQYESAMLRANTAALVGDWKTAGVAAEQASKVQPQAAKPYLIQAIARAHSGTYDKTLEELLQTGVKLGPNQPFSQEAVATLAMQHWPLWPTSIQEHSLASFEFMLTYRPKRLMWLLRRNSASTLFCGVIQYRLDSPAFICNGDTLYRRLPSG